MIPQYLLHHLSPPTYISFTQSSSQSIHPSQSSKKTKLSIDDKNSSSSNDNEGDSGYILDLLMHSMHLNPQRRLTLSKLLQLPIFHDLSMYISIKPSIQEEKKRQQDHQDHFSISLPHEPWSTLMKSHVIREIYEYIHQNAMPTHGSYEDFVLDENYMKNYLKEMTMKGKAVVEDIKSIKDKDKRYEDRSSSIKASDIINTSTKPLNAGISVEDLSLKTTGTLIVNASNTILSGLDIKEAMNPTSTSMAVKSSVDMKTTHGLSTAQSMTSEPTIVLKAVDNDSISTNKKRLISISRVIPMNDLFQSTQMITPLKTDESLHCNPYDNLPPSHDKQSRRKSKSIAIKDSKSIEATVDINASDAVTTNVQSQSYIDTQEKRGINHHETTELTSDKRVNHLDFNRESSWNSTRNQSHNARPHHRSYDSWPDKASSAVNPDHPRQPSVHGSRSSIDWTSHQVSSDSRVRSSDWGTTDNRSASEWPDSRCDSREDRPESSFKHQRLEPPMNDERNNEDEEYSQIMKKKHVTRAVEAVDSIIDSVDNDTNENTSYNHSKQDDISPLHDDYTDDPHQSNHSRHTHKKHHNHRSRSSHRVEGSESDSVKSRHKTSSRHTERSRHRIEGGDSDSDRSRRKAHKRHKTERHRDKDARQRSSNGRERAHKVHGHRSRQSREGDRQAQSDEGLGDTEPQNEMTNLPTRAVDILSGSVDATHETVLADKSTDQLPVMTSNSEVSWGTTRNNDWLGDIDRSSTQQPLITASDSHESWGTNRINNWVGSSHDGHSSNASARVLSVVSPDNVNSTSFSSDQTMKIVKKSRFTQAHDVINVNSSQIPDGSGNAARQQPLLIDSKTQNTRDTNTSDWPFEEFDSKYTPKRSTALKKPAQVKVSLNLKQTRLVASELPDQLLGTLVYGNKSEESSGLIESSIATPVGVSVLNSSLTAETRNQTVKPTVAIAYAKKLEERKKRFASDTVSSVMPESTATSVESESVNHILKDRKNTREDEEITTLNQQELSTSVESPRDDSGSNNELINTSPTPSSSFQRLFQKSVLQIHSQAATLLTARTVNTGVPDAKKRPNKHRPLIQFKIKQDNRVSDVVSKDEQSRSEVYVDARSLIQAKRQVSG